MDARPARAIEIDADAHRSLVARLDRYSRDRGDDPTPVIKDIVAVIFPGVRVRIPTHDALLPGGAYWD